MIATAAEFLALAKPKTATVDVGGSTVHVRELSVRERSEMLALMEKDRGMVPAFLVQKCAITPEGKPLFTDKEAEALAASAPAIVDKVAAAVMRASGMGEDDGPNA